MRRENKAVYIFNLAIFGLMVFGYSLSILFPQEKRLPSKGLLNLRYFTTLSNIFAGVVALIVFIYLIRNKEKTGLPPALSRLKLMSASAVMVTFLVVIAFLGPVYGFEKLYSGSSFFYHLVIPLAALIDYIFVEKMDKIPFRDTALAVVFVLIYGTFYLLNIAINGVGEWPNTNDWYGFTTWGLPATFLIFSMITLVSWIIAVIMRGLHLKLKKS